MHIPIISHIPAYLPIPYSHTAHKLQKIQPQIKQDQRFRPRKPGTRGSLQIPCVDCRRGAACPGGAPARRDQRPVHSNLRIQPVSPPSLHQRPVYSNTRQSNSLKFPGGHGHGIAWRCGDDVAVGPRVQARPKAGACGPRRGSPRNLNRLDSTKVRRRGAGSRRTDGRSRRPGPASRLRCAVGVPRLYLFEYPLQRFFDSFQFVVCLFLAFNKDVKPAVYSAVKHPCEYPQHAPLALYRY